MKKASQYIHNASLVLGSFAFALAFAEVLFRIPLYFGLVNTVTNTYSMDPYGYYLWSKEGGHPSGINNRYGYADHDFEMEKKSGIKRIAIIGDSFVEALQVGIPDKMGAVLQSNLNESSSQQYEVVSFGRSGEYPAHYLERLKKIASRFSPDIVFVLIYMGNDFRNASLEIERRTSGMTPDQYIFYQVDSANKSVKPYPQSKRLIDNFEKKETERWAYKPSAIERIDRFLRKISFLYSEIPSRLELLKKKFRAGGRAASSNPTTITNNECTEETIYLKSYASCWATSEVILESLIREMREYSEGAGIKLFFIGIPANESYWGDQKIKKIATASSSIMLTDYDKILAKKYSVADSDVDLARPNKLFNKIMRESGVQYFDLYNKFYEEITKKKRKVYCRLVYGHLCEDGHRIVATEMAHLVNGN